MQVLGSAQDSDSLARWFLQEAPRMWDQSVAFTSRLQVKTVSILKDFDSSAKESESLEGEREYKQNRTGALFHSLRFVSDGPVQKGKEDWIFACNPNYVFQLRREDKTTDWVLRSFVWTAECKFDPFPRNMVDIWTSRQFRIKGIRLWSLVHEKEFRITNATTVSSNSRNLVKIDFTYP
jgi:hypothetical protein